MVRRINIWDEKCGGSGVSFFDSVGDVFEDGEVEMCVIGFFGVGFINNFGV